MKERPILFSAPMVRALLAGTKTQTRRIVKLRGAEDIERETPSNWWPWSPEQNDWVPCPYGEAGDRLWVRETWRSASSLDKLSPTEIGKGAISAGWKKPWAPLQYEADGLRRDWEDSFGEPSEKTRVSIHMPRWASRLTLAVTGVRVERLKDISGLDAMAEGLTQCGDKGWHAGDEATCWTDPRDAYRALWESINGADSWALNPWAWVVEFKRINQETS